MIKAVSDTCFEPEQGFTPSRPICSHPKNLSHLVKHPLQQVSKQALSPYLLSQKDVRKVSVHFPEVSLDKKTKEIPEKFPTHLINQALFKNGRDIFHFYKHLKANGSVKFKYFTPITRHYTAYGDTRMYNLIYYIMGKDKNHYEREFNLCGHVYLAKGKATFKEVKSPQVNYELVGGMQDPRMFCFNNKVYLIANGVKKEDGKRRMFLCDTTQKKWVELKVLGESFPSSQEKNWVPYEYQGELYFLYSLKPLSVLKVTDVENGQCSLIKGKLYDMATGQIFGSTPLVSWDENNWVGFAHTRHPWRAIPIKYNPHTLSLDFVGKAIHFKPPKEAEAWRRKSVQFPYDIKILPDSVRVGIEFEDRCSTWLHLDKNAFKKAFKLS